MTTKTEVRKEISKHWRKHWVSAFLKLAFDETKTIEENKELCFNWLYDNGRTWEQTKREMELK
jgi:hypothetical protein